MSKLSRVNAVQALRYRGGQPMLAWLLHRITGVGIVLFVGMHIWMAFFLYAVEGGPTLAISQALTDFYEALPMQIFVLFCIIFHALNGLRIAILDMWPALHAHHQEAMWVQWALFLPAFILPAALMIMRVTV